MDEAAQQQYSCINYNSNPVKPNVLYELYILGCAMVGEQKSLLKVWDIMHMIYRNTVAPHVGNSHQIHGKLNDIMYDSSLTVGQGKKLDVMDTMWHCDDEKETFHLCFSHYAIDHS